MTCRNNIQCWGQEHYTEGAVYCSIYVEGLAKYDYEWTDDFLGVKFSHFVWKDRNKRFGYIHG